MKAVIVAGGRGVRLRPLTQKIPKAMVKLKGKTLLEWNLERLAELGIKDVAVIVGYMGEVITKAYGKKYKDVELTYIEQKPLLGTAHAIGLAEKFISGEDFLVLYCDVIVEKGVLQSLVNVSEFSPYDALMVGRKVSDPWRFGVIVQENGKVKDIVEKPAFGEEPSDTINAGAYRFNSSIFDAIRKIEKSERGEYEITDALKNLAAEGRVGIIMCSDVCVDIADVQDLKDAEGKIG